MADAITKKEPTTFMSLPGELRNYIYELSGCLKIYQCRNCRGTIRGDDHGRQGPHKGCAFSKDATQRCEYLAKAYLWVNRQSRRKKKDCAIPYDKEKQVVGVSQPALSKVNKQIRAETLSIFYGESWYVFTVFNYHKMFSEPSKWLQRIGPANARLVDKIEIVLPYAKDEEWKEDTVRELKKHLEWLGFQKTPLLRSRAYGKCRCEDCILPKEKT